MGLSFRERLALSNEGLTNASAILGVGAAEVWSVIAAGGLHCGYLSDRRPQMRYERRVFHRLTAGPL